MPEPLTGSAADEQKVKLSDHLEIPIPKKTVPISRTGKK
jgi:hypothetical protein